VAAFPRSVLLVIRGDTEEKYPPRFSRRRRSLRLIVRVPLRSLLQFSVGDKP